MFTTRGCHTVDGTYKGPVSEVRPKKRNTRSTTTFLRGGLLYYVISKIPVEFLRLNQSSDINLKVSNTFVWIQNIWNYIIFVDTLSCISERLVSAEAELFFSLYSNYVPTLSGSLSDSLQTPSRSLCRLFHNVFKVFPKYFLKYVQTLFKHFSHYCWTLVMLSTKMF